MQVHFSMERFFLLKHNFIICICQTFCSVFYFFNVYSLFSVTCMIVFWLGLFVAMTIWELYADKKHLWNTSECFGSFLVEDWDSSIEFNNIFYDAIIHLFKRNIIVSFLARKIYYSCQKKVNVWYFVPGTIFCDSLHKCLWNGCESALSHTNTNTSIHVLYSWWIPEKDIKHTFQIIF